MSALTVHLTDLSTSDTKCPQAQNPKSQTDSLLSSLNPVWDLVFQRENLQKCTESNLHNAQCTMHIPRHFSANTESTKIGQIFQIHHRNTAVFAIVWLKLSLCLPPLTKKLQKYIQITHFQLIKSGCKHNN